MRRYLRAPAASFGKSAKVIKTECNRSSSSVASGKTATTAPSDDSSRYYIARAHQKLHDGRYETLHLLGSGRYSQVWLAKDRQQNSFVALKVLTSDCYGTKHDIFELEILQEIARQQAKLDQDVDTHVIALLDNFRLSAPAGCHECLVMPVVGCNINSQIRRFSNRRIPVQVVKEITKQLLKGLSFLHDKCQAIHTDLQPSNICFAIGDSEVAAMAHGQTSDEVSPTATEEEPGNVKIIDLGVASWTHKHLSDRIQPEHLRAPEVVLGAPWGPPVDVWSLGCLILEFVQGHVAFPGSASKHGTWTSADDHLAQYMEVLGPMPRELLDRGAKTGEYFDSQGNLLRIPALQKTTLKDFVDGEEFPLTRPRDMSAQEVPVFVDFLEGALALDPHRRKTARQLLQHEWLETVYEG